MMSTKMYRKDLLKYLALLFLATKISKQSIGEKFLSKDDAIDLAIHFSSKHHKAKSAGLYDVNQNV